MQHKIDQVSYGNNVEDIYEIFEIHSTAFILFIAVCCAVCSISSGVAEPANMEIKTLYCAGLKICPCVYFMDSNVC